MGCPDKSIEKQGCGAAMIKNPTLAKEIITAARKGFVAGSQKEYAIVPVSVKTRIGYNKESIDEWIPELLSMKLPALTVHLRTRKEMSKVAAHWDLMPRVVALRDSVSPTTLIIGNGDVKSVEEGHQKAELFGADGIMLGRAIFGNPYVFAAKFPEDLSVSERLSTLAQLAEYFDDIRPVKSFHIFKKHIKAFVSGFDGASELRAQLMECENSAGIKSVITSSNLV